MIAFGRHGGVALTAALALCLWAPAARAQTPVRISLLQNQLQVVLASAGGLVVRPYRAGAPVLLAPELST
ncbi:MAG: hypothetical protein M3Z37_09295, partial [Candidatus Eremiobacteraeota bacterium]|nr:hypothetical protein [Candidatus Eremiobacteraeota bacterium]